MPEQVPESGSRRLNDALRAWYAVFSDLSRQFATDLGMHSSDAAALVQITAAEERGAPLTQSELSRSIGLTTPATSSLLNRLEEAGHVQRLRDRSDRRVVTLRSTAAMHEHVNEYFAAIGDEVDRIAAGYPDELIASFTELVTAMTGAMRRYLDDAP